MKNISILGSTGSIGTQALEVAEHLGVNIIALAANKNVDLLEKQIRKFKPRVVAVYDKQAAQNLRKNLTDVQIIVLEGMEGLCEVASMTDAELVLTAVSGMIGLEPTLAAIKSKKNIALANKETLVAGGDLVMQAARENDVKILPVDSEHSAIFQCLEGCKDKKQIKKLILTASGGTFFGRTKDQLENITVEEALNHPSWNMGPKITIDSATLMNKGLEIIEAAHLFGIDADNIDVIVHKESVIHSMVEYVDDSIIAQMGTPDMKMPIQYAITYPNRANSLSAPLDLTKYKNLSFFEPNYETFEAINICKEALKIDGTMPAIINAANEEAVKLFLNKKIKFLEIIDIVKEAMNSFDAKHMATLDDVLRADKKVRGFVFENFSKKVYNY